MSTLGSVREHRAGRDSPASRPRTRKPPSPFAETVGNGPLDVTRPPEPDFPPPRSACPRLPPPSPPRPRPPVGLALDRAAAATTWLVVGGESQTAAEAAGRVPGLVLGRIDRLEDAAGLLEDGAADAVLLDAAACDDLPGALAELRAAAPAAAVVVASDRLDVAEAVEALRGGAADYLPGETPADEAAERMRLAAGRRWLDAHTDRRLLRLKSAVRQLNRARRAVGRRVDLLCGDLVGAYGDVAEQVERVRRETSLTDLLNSAADLEQLLCHAMDWLLRHAGTATSPSSWRTTPAGRSWGRT